MLYVETSAKSQENVERAFVWPANNILDRIEGGFIKVDPNNQAIKINKNSYEEGEEENKKCECWLGMYLNIYSIII